MLGRSVQAGHIVPLFQSERDRIETRRNNGGWCISNVCLGGKKGL